MAKRRLGDAGDLTLAFGWLVALVAPLLFFVVARQLNEEIRREAEWSGIEIEED